MRRLGANWSVLAVLAALASAGRAHAHTPGLSTGAYTAEGDEIAVELVLQRGDAAKLFPEADGDGDGELSATELFSGKELLAGALPRRLVVRVDGAPCAPRFGDARPVEGDGVLVEATFGCPTGSMLGVLPAFFGPLGDGHRHLARLEGGIEGVRDEVATSAAPALAYPLRARPIRAKAHPARRVPVGLMVGAVGAAGLAAFVAARRRRLRAARQASVDDPPA